MVPTILVALSLTLSAGQGACSGSLQAVSGPFLLSVTEGFTIAVIPDTQCYTAEGSGAAQQSCGGPHSAITNEMFIAQARYTAENVENARIVAVIGVGDIVQCGDQISEWENARKAYDIIDATGLPYVPVIGNHDYDGACGAPVGRRSVNYNTYFGPSRFAGKPWYGGGFPANSNDNFFIRFSVDGENYLVLALEWVPRDATLDWAKQIVETHFNHKIIVALHEHLDQTGQWSVHRAGNGGVLVWDKFLRHHENIIVVLSGHSLTSRRVDAGEVGNLVPQLQSNYQHDEAGGNGYMRLLHFRPANRSITVFTYSPFVQSRRLDPDNDFSVEYGIP